MAYIYTTQGPCSVQTEVELNPDYFRDGVGYCERADAEQDAPTLVDLMEAE